MFRLSHAKVQLIDVTQHSEFLHEAHAIDEKTILRILYLESPSRISPVRVDAAE
jgi:hypothetical protein